MVKNYIVSVKLLAELIVPIDTDDMSRNNTLKQLCESLEKKDGKYAVCGKDPKKLTASLHITDVTVLKAECPFCNRYGV